MPCCLRAVLLGEGGQGNAGTEASTSALPADHRAPGLLASAPSLSSIRGMISGPPPASLPSPPINLRIFRYPGHTSALVGFTPELEGPLLELRQAAPDRPITDQGTAFAWFVLGTGDLARTMVDLEVT